MRRSTTLRTAPWLASSALLLLACAGAGCEQTDPADQAIRAATTELSRLTAGGRIADPRAGKREAGLKSVVSMLEPHTKGDGVGQASAANLLTARAKAGLAELKSSPAQALEERAAAQASGIRSQLELWLVQSARAKASASYDPAPELAALAKLSEDLKKSHADTAAKQLRLEAGVAELERRQGDLLTQGQALRAQSATLVVDAAGMSATAGLPLVQQSAGLNRKADGLDVSASELEAQAATQQPVIEQLKRDLTSLDAQRSQAESAAAGVRTRSEFAKAQAAEAGGVAAKAGGEISDKLAALMAFRSGELVGLSESAANGYQQAVAAARAALTGAGKPQAKQAANLALGSYQQGKGDALITSSRGLTIYADLLADLSRVSPPLPKQAEIVAELAKASEEAKAKSEEAKAAFTEAYESFSKASDADKLKGLTDRMQKLAGVQKAAEDAAPAGDQPAAAPAPAATADDPAVAVRQVLGELLAATNASETAKVLGMLHHPTPEDKEFWDSIAPASIASAELDKACKEKFGKGLAELGMGGAGGGLAGMEALASLNSPEIMAASPADFEVKVLSDTAAQASHPSHAQHPLNFVKVEGGWKLSVPVPESSRAAMKMMAPMLKRMESLPRDLAAQVRAGTITSPEELQAVMMRALQAGMPGGGGGGG